MGFGLLFIGYFFMLNFPFQGIDLLPDVVGCIIMLVAVRKLLLYCDDRASDTLRGRSTPLRYSRWRCYFTSSPISLAFYPKYWRIFTMYL